ncbi:hypothetical protein DFH27DRAFT_74380 [Peziza echinospora]|nr:hypothetical protein DFH27DRAFT_74380 [Peziza echinospora]
MSDRGGRGRGRDRGGGRGGRGQYSNHHGSHDDYDMDGRGQHSYDHDYRKRDDDWRGDYRRGDVRDAGGGAARREPLPNPPHSASRSEFSVPPPRPPPKAPSRERSRESISRGGGGVGGGGGDRGAGPAVGGAGGGPPSVPAAIHTKGIGAAGSLVSVQSPRERGMINDSKAPIAPGQLGPRRPGSLSIPPSRDLFDADQQAQYSPSRRKDSISEPSPRGAGGLARPPSSSKAHASPHLGGSEMSPISAAGSSSKMVRSSSHTLRPDSPSTMATDQPISE